MLHPLQGLAGRLHIQNSHVKAFFIRCDQVVQLLTTANLHGLKERLDKISETQIHCVLLKTKYFSWFRNSLRNCQKVGK